MDADAVLDPVEMALVSGLIMESEEVVGRFGFSSMVEQTTSRLVVRAHPTNAPFLKLATVSRGGAGHMTFASDEGPSLGGLGSAPTPLMYFSAALAF